MKKLVYVSHPLLPTDQEIEAVRYSCGNHDPAEAARHDNIERATRWVAWVARGGFIPVATWITLANVWNIEIAFLLMLDVELIYRCDELWLVGGRISEKMTIERRAAEFSSIRVRDLTRLGPEPPTERPTEETIK